MKKYAHTIRWVGESIVILAVVSSLPWLYRVSGCGMGTFYDPSPVIFCIAGVPYSACVSRPTVRVGNEFYIAVFTGACVDWYKGYSWSESLHYADRDTYWAAGTPYTIHDTVQHSGFFGGDQLWNWFDDQTSATNAILATSYFKGLNEMSGAFHLYVRDTDHLGPPGTTDDPADEVVSSYYVYWKKPNAEITECIDCYGVKNAFGAGHYDTYRVTETRTDMSISFSDLWMREIVNINSDECHIQPVVMYTISPTSLDANSQWVGNDVLAQTIDNPNSQAPRNCEVVNRQFLAIGPTSSGPWLRRSYNSKEYVPHTFRIKSGDTWDKFTSQRGSTGCDDWPAW